METTKLWKLIQRWIDHQMWTPNQSQIAEKLGVSRSAVSQWKTGQSRPTPESLRGLARLTGISFIDLRTALVEDMGYTTTPESEMNDDAASMNRAPVSGAEPTTVHVEMGDVPVNPREAEVTGAQPPRSETRADRP